MNAMKRFARICALSAAASLLVALCAATPIQAATVVASLRSVAGPVDILRGGALPAVPAKNGDQVASGDLIRTKSGGFAEVAYSDGTVLRISERSRVDIGEHFSGKSPDSSEVRLTRGKVKAIVDLQNVKSSGTGPKKFEVRTPNAIAGVRGTGFTVSHGRGVTNVYVQTGTVYSLNPSIPGKVVTLTPGTITTVSGSNAPAPPRQALPGEVQKMEQGTTAPPAGSSSGGAGGAGGAAASDKGDATSDKGDTGKSDKGDAATSDKGDAGKSDQGDTAKSDKGEATKSDKGDSAKSDKGDNGGGSGGTAAGGTAASADSGGTAASTGAGGTTAAAETTGTAGTNGTTGTTDTAGTTGKTVTAGSTGTVGTTESAAASPTATGTAKIAVIGGGISSNAPAVGAPEVFITAPSLPVMPVAGVAGTSPTNAAPLLSTIAQGAGAVIQSTTSTPVPTNANTAAPTISTQTQTIAPVQPKPSTANVKINVNF